MVKVHLYAGQPHYADHLLPIFDALPAEVQGYRYSHRPGPEWADRVLREERPHGLWLVAGATDAQRLGPVPMVLAEHGAGQSYAGDPLSASMSSYAGGQGHQWVQLFLAPGEQAAARWRHTYPDTPVAVVGCPKLDQWHQAEPHQPGEQRVVAFTFHWPCALVPETQWALPHYRPALTGVAEALTGVDAVPLGHGHPRAWRQLRAEWARRGIWSTPDAADVLDHADVLVGDNTSLLYEFASLGRPVVVLNAPWYRRDVQHGLRFWSHVPGRQVDHPDQLLPAVLAALADPDADTEVREAAVAAAYAHTDGRAAQRAADAIVEVVTMPNPFAPRRHRRAEVPEQLSELEQFLGRMRQVGATDDEVAEFAAGWDEFDDDWTPAKRTAVLGWSDEQLHENLVAVRAEYAEHTTTEAEAAQQAAEHDAALQARQAEGIIGRPVGEVLAWVGTDPVRAEAVRTLETGPNGGNRKTLLAGIDKALAPEA